MTSALPAPADLPVLPTLACPHCEAVVPDARYCGACGASLKHEGFTASQRLHSYGAFPDEPVLRLTAVTSLFPQLSHRAKAPFRVATALVVALIAVFALAGLAAPLIAVCALGFPTLFLLYIWEVDPYEGSFLLPTAVCLVGGAALGVGWAFIGRSFVDQALRPVLGAELTGSHAIAAAVLVPGVGQLLMCIPMVVVWAFLRGDSESLDGFAAGASSALGLTTAATIVLMSPWFSQGQLTHQSFTNNLAEAVLRGISLPLVSALTTGLVGAAVWASTGSRRTAAKGRWLTSPFAALVAALVVQIGLGYTDIALLSVPVLIGVHLVAIALTILLVRIGLHHVLLHEAHSVAIGPPTVCAHCAHLVPVMAFCPQCGVAERAVTRRHRGRHPDPVTSPGERDGDDGGAP